MAVSPCSRPDAIHSAPGLLAWPTPGGIPEAMRDRQICVRMIEMMASEFCLERIERAASFCISRARSFVVERLPAYSTLVPFGTEPYEVLVNPASRILVFSRLSPIQWAMSL